MITELKLTDHNREVYVELLKDMMAHKDGLFNCVLQLSAGEIVSYVIADNIPPTTNLDEPRNNQFPGPPRVVGQEVTIWHANTECSAK